ncbi:cupin domain-containing protein [Actinomadura macrotermitis]|uniref:(S)-ureidoglycine aminohydrolase cupin domain-containing protein n=1 Tax=Actinomadura macrotermitis TaxID=2585200 RepID=A0A7K0C3I8_9ACTN|nr:cupin domain-containing protein [Actinomadura macrotermitis]MQY08005.1 hypothetical protein [Actinomadura macrotermitis]
MPASPPAGSFCVDPAALELEPCPIGGEILAGAPATRAAVLYEDEHVERGVWEITPGTVTDVEADEMFTVLSGRATVEVAGGPVLELGPGSLGVLREGAQTVWRVHETLRKTYQITRRAPA